MTEHKINDQVVWSCSVSTYEWCAHTVKWLFEGKDVDEHHKDLQTSQSDCSASVTFTTSHFIHTSNSDLLTCEVTDGYKVQLFPFRLQPSGEEPGDTTTKPRPEPTTKPPTATTKTPTATATTESSIKRGTITTAPAKNGSANLKGHWLWWIIAVSLVAAVFIIIVVVVIIRAEGKKTQTDEDVADPEGGVSYASVNFTQRPGGKARVQGGDDDEDDEAVTYTTVKAPSSSSAAAAGASADANALYATVNKPR
ncbi:uncharacterized protein LOC109142199 isoform X2 [Larimichthys crocea]|nr:uncharacterized protein LOC109142199 isoform X2 [Larimichthys crocea]